NHKNVAGAGAGCGYESSDQQRNTTNLLHEHLSRLLLAGLRDDFWDRYNGLHQAASPTKVPGASSIVSCRSATLPDFQTSQESPINAQRRSRRRRVKANAKPSTGEKPVTAKAEIAPPSSESSRAGIQPLTSFNPRVIPSMASTGKK